MADNKDDSLEEYEKVMKDLPGVPSEDEMDELNYEPSEEAEEIVDSLTHQEVDEEEETERGVEMELPEGFDPEFGYEEDDIPAGIKTLFPDENARKSTDLAKITETPPKMIVPLVRAEIIVAAQDVNRTKPLLQLFVEKFDRRMISKDRKGRLEAVEMYKGVAAAEDDEDEALL